MINKIRKKNILYIYRLKYIEIEHWQVSIENRSRLVFSLQGEPFLDPTALDRFAFLQMFFDKFIDVYTLPCWYDSSYRFSHIYTHTYTQKYIYIYIFLNDTFLIE